MRDQACPTHRPQECHDSSVHGGTLHDDGKFHDGDNHVSTMAVSSTMEARSMHDGGKLHDTFHGGKLRDGGGHVPRGSIHTVPKSVFIQTLCPRVLQWRQPCDDMLDNSRSLIGGCMEIASVSDAVWLFTLNISELPSSGGHKPQDLSLLWLGNA